MLRYAPRFHGKNSKKKFKKKNSKKFKILLCLNSYAYNRGSTCEKKFWGSRPAGLEGLAKLLYRLLYRLMTTRLRDIFVFVPIGKRKQRKRKQIKSKEEKQQTLKRVNYLFKIY
jgi:hypothetical protein